MNKFDVTIWAQMVISAIASPRWSDAQQYVAFLKRQDAIDEEERSALIERLIAMHDTGEFLKIWLNVNNVSAVDV